MSDVKVCRTVVVNNPQGLHLRPANLIVRLARQYQAKIELVKDNHRVDGRSITDLMTLAAEQGAELTIEAVGPDAPQVLKVLADLFASNFADYDKDENQTTKD